MSEKSPQRGRTIVNASLLREFVDGKLDSAMQAKVAAFIEKNPKLQAQVDAMSGDGFLDRIRDAHAMAQPSAPSPNWQPAADIDNHAPSQLQEPPDASPPSAVVASSMNLHSEVPAELKNFAGYEILKELGRGGMGVVYLAKNRQMGDRFEVLKVLNERLVAVPEAKERFVREITSVAKLSHPSIVVGYSVLPLPNLIVFAMEYVQGTDLSKFIRKNHPVPVNLVCSIAQQIANGLQHGHERKLVHRDIKPSNIMIYKSGNRIAAKILDFGLAKASSEQVSDGLTQDGMMLGTPEYVAPEQMMDAAKSDIGADIYSLGCTIYHMLTGRPPFTGTAREIMLAHVQKEAPMVHLLRPDVPIELSAIVAKMMAKESHRRFQTPTEVVNALKPFLGRPLPSTEQPATLESIDEASSERSKDTLGNAAPADVDTSVEGIPTGVRPIQSLVEISPRDTTISPAKSMRGGSRRNSWIGIAITTLALLFGGGLWLAGILTIKTENGTLVIENLPEDSEVTVDGNKANVSWNEGKDTANLSIESGSHEVQVKRGELLVAGKKVTIVEGEKLSWTIQFQESDEKKSPDSTDLTPPATITTTDHSTVFQVGDVFEGNWTNHAAGETESDGTSFMTVTVTERNIDEVTTVWRLHTWDGLWLYKGKLFTNDDGSLLFRSTDADKVNGYHVNEGNTELVLELDSSGKQFKGKANYKSGRRSEFEAVRTQKATSALDDENLFNRTGAKSQSTQTSESLEVSRDDRPNDFEVKLVESEEAETDVGPPSNEVLEREELLAIGSKWEGTLEAKASFIDERKFTVTKAEIVEATSDGFLLRTQTLDATDGDWFSWEYRIKGGLDQLQIVEAKLIKKTASFSDSLGVRELRSSNVQVVDDELHIKIDRPISGGSMYQSYVLKYLNDQPVVDEVNFPQGTRTRFVSKKEITIYDDAVRTRRKLTNPRFEDGFAGWEKRLGAESFIVFTDMCQSWGAGKNADSGRLFQCFVVPENATDFRFKIHGGNDIERLYTALWYKDNEIFRSTARNDNTSFRVSCDVSQFQGRTLTLEVVDTINDGRRPWSFIAAGSFEFLGDGKVIEQ